MARSATTGLDSYYGSEPWSAWDINQRDWYVPLLQRAYRIRSNYGQMVPIKVDFTAQRTGTIIWTGIYDLEPAIDSIGLHDIWLDSSYTDGWQIRIGMHHYGDKIALHKWEPLVTFFAAGGVGGAGNLAGLCRQLLGNSIIDTMEVQIRNAFVGLHTAYFVGGGSGFSDISDADLFDPNMAADIQLGFAYHEVVDPNQPGGLTAVAYASPGQVYSAQKDDEYISVRRYNVEGMRQLLRYEVGETKGIRYINHPVNTLFNAGNITAQAPVSAAIHAGDGSPDPGADGSGTKVLGTYEVGQKKGTQVHYIQLGSFGVGSIADLKVGDKISIHTLRSDGQTLPFDVVNAPLPTDGTKEDRIIVGIDAGNGRVMLDKPIMRDYTTELASGVYAYLTKGQHIHVCVIQAAPGAVVGGFAQPPQLHVPPAVDDLEAMFRLSWDGYYDYSRFRTETACVVFSAGYVNFHGHIATGA